MTPEQMLQHARAAQRALGFKDAAVLLRKPTHPYSLAGRWRCRKKVTRILAMGAKPIALLGIRQLDGAFEIRAGRLPGVPVRSSYLEQLCENFKAEYEAGAGTGYAVGELRPHEF